MDSDLSLIEISGEDDSLLRPITGGDDSSSFSNAGHVAADCFLISPLQLPRSNSNTTDFSVGKENLSTECANKENFNVEKSETAKLGVEPQQMKKRKKGGGYNLRQSLAWNRAFFTEEGVLDAAELSMISGNFGKSSNQTLSAIQEKVVGNSSNLHTIEEKLFKESPVATSDKTKRVGGNLLPKKRNNDAAPTSVGFGKVLSTRDGNRSGLNRSACPRPVVSSSTLKRSATLVATKALEKDSKVSKLPIQKPSPSAIPSRIEKSSKSSASDSKRSQIPRPDRNTQKNYGPSSSTKSVTNISKADRASKSLSSKTSLGQAKRNVASSVKRTLTSEKLPLNTEANNSLKVFVNTSSPSTGYPSNFHGNRPGQFAAPLLQNTQVAENQVAKPTGLRMPSPSLGFFGQSKAPTLQSPLKMVSQTCKVPESNISNPKKRGIPTPACAQKPPRAPRNLPKVTVDGTATNFSASGSGSGSSMSPALNLASREPDSNLEKNNDRKVENNLKNSEQSNEIMKENELRGTVGGVDQQSFGRVGRLVTDESFEQEDIKLHRNDKSLFHRQLDKNAIGVKVDGSTKGSYRTDSETLPHSGSVVEVTDPCGDSETAELKLEEDEPFSLSLKNHSVVPQFTSEKSIVEQQSGDPLEENPLTDETGPTFGDIQMLQENVADESPQLHSTEQEQEDIIAPGKMTTRSTMEDLGVQLLDGDFTGIISNSYSSVTVDVQHQETIGEVTEKPEQEEFPEPLHAGGNALQDGVMMLVDDCLLGVKSFSNEEAKQENGSLSHETEDGDTRGSVLISSSEPSMLPVTLLDGGLDMAKLVEFQNKEDCQSLSIDSKSVADSYDPDNLFQRDGEIRYETSLMELGNMEGHMVDVGTSEDVNVTCPNSGQETSNIVSAPSLVLLLDKGDASTDYRIEPADVEEEKRLSLSVDSLPCNSDQPEDSFCHDHDDYTVGQICVLEGEDDVNKHHEEEEKQMAPCFGDFDSKSCEEKQCSEVDCLVFQDTRSLEEPHKFEIGNNTNDYPEVSSLAGSGLENLASPVPEKMGEQDENCEFQDPVIETVVGSTERVLGVGLGPMSQLNCSVEVFNEESQSVLNYRSDSETEKIDYGAMEFEATWLPVDGLNDATHENSAHVLDEKNDCESTLELSDACQIEAKITCNQVTTQPDDGHGNSKETEPSIVEVATTTKFESQSSVKDVDLKTNSLKSDSWANQSDKDEIREQKKAGINKKQDNLVIKPPANVVPFSDEWLAAIEAAGEEILTMKSGNVQNSPQERSQPEPSPWSPVKRKQHQTLGPFDCTKHTNH